MSLRGDKRFDEFLADSFKDGTCVRELRLTNAELTYVRLKFPKSRVKKLPKTNTNTLKKEWYEVRIK
ncbi:hypothetical protein VBD025_05080 [Virgibacillus flavescens]|uniref:hypothetical protein n=1 Tax=Virgibacillus flavescens TaxID=1611422 RepID=UPI003D34330C